MALVAGWPVRKPNWARSPGLPTGPTLPPYDAGAASAGSGGGACPAFLVFGAVGSCHGFGATGAGGDSGTGGCGVRTKAGFEVPGTGTAGDIHGGSGGLGSARLGFGLISGGPTATRLPLSPRTVPAGAPDPVAAGNSAATARRVLGPGRNERRRETAWPFQLAVLRESARV